MEIRKETIQDVDVLALEGRLDASLAKQLKSQVQDLIGAGRINMVVDLEAVDFLDSSGLGSLVAALRSVNKLNGDIKLASLQEPVRVIIELTRLHRVFEIFGNAAEAVESF
ncbi:STAS domain-containing protein [Desulfobacter vibrioformis]|uniref:STAS domain-containing protein n=1 Tax=Desulfobacter vibrioformis TaxID=34031 RepID=UPI00054D690F|nr:STAS domain-containing protein [Desulfobacter vibrioformis]